MNPGDLGSAPRTADVVPYRELFAELNAIHHVPLELLPYRKSVNSVRDLLKAWLQILVQL